MKNTKDFFLGLQKTTRDAYCDFLKMKDLDSKREEVKVTQGFIDQLSANIHKYEDLSSPRNFGDEVKRLPKVASRFLALAKDELYKLASIGSFYLEYDIYFDDNGIDEKGKISEDYRGTELLLPQMCIEEGISFCYNPGHKEEPKTYFSFSITEFGSKDSINKLTKGFQLRKKTQHYLDFEAKYSKRMSKGEDEIIVTVEKIHSEILNRDVQKDDSEVDTDLLLDSLSNAAYRNGLEGTFSDELGNLEIRPTFMRRIGCICEPNITNISNYILINHNEAKVKQLTRKPRCESRVK